MWYGIVWHGGGVKVKLVVYNFTRRRAATRGSKIEAMSDGEEFSFEQICGLLVEIALQRALWRSLMALLSLTPLIWTAGTLVRGFSKASVLSPYLMRSSSPLVELAQASRAVDTLSTSRPPTFATKSWSGRALTSWPPS